MSDQEFIYQKYVLPMRRRNQAAGRTVFNKPRRQVARPELHGLTGAAYLKSYRALRAREREAQAHARFVALDFPHQKVL